LSLFYSGFSASFVFAQEPISEPEEEFFEDDDEYIEEPYEEVEEQRSAPAAPPNRNNYNPGAGASTVRNGFSNGGGGNNGVYNMNANRGSSFGRPGSNEQNPVEFRLTEPRKYWKPKKKGASNKNL